MNEHELVSHVLGIVDSAAYRNAAARVRAVHVEIGGRRVLDLEALKGDFQRCARGTVADGAELCVRVLPVTRHCQNCGSDFQADSHDLPCPKCAHPHTEPVNGEEARVVDIEVEGSCA